MDLQSPEDATDSPGEVTLPNGMSVRIHNVHETEFMFREIFQEHVYTRCGVTLTGKQPVIDIGANIGLFSLFVKSLAPEARILAFEPAPVLFEILRHNLSPYSSTVLLFKAGLSDHEGFADFVFYPGHSIMSGFHAEDRRDYEILKEGILDQVRTKTPSLLGIVSPRVGKMAKEKLANPTVSQVQIISLPSVFQELPENESVQLLKIDAEGAEVQILRGLRPQDWERVDQIVMEVHGEAEYQEVKTALTRHGFSVETDFGVGNCESITKNLIAIRNSR